MTGQLVRFSVLWLRLINVSIILLLGLCHRRGSARVAWHLAAKCDVALGLKILYKLIGIVFICIYFLTKLL